MKVISSFDLLRIEALSHLTIFDIINPANDSIVNPFLAIMGIDLDYGVNYYVAYHRTLSNETKVGYVLAGELQCNRAFVNSPWCSAMDRLIISGYNDRSLAYDLMLMNGTSVDYSTVHALDEKDNEQVQNILDNYQDKEVTERIEEEMRVLQEILDNVRGDQYTKGGTLKTPEQYHEEETEVKFFRNKRNKRNKEI